jgi:hypothetical protein
MNTDEMTELIEVTQALIDTYIPVDDSSIITGEALNTVLNAIIEIL